jgi:hypothetical protein
LALIEIGDGGRTTFRLCGTNLMGRFGGEFTNRSVAELGTEVRPSVETYVGLTDILYQRDGDYCIADVPSRRATVGAKVCGAGGRYPSDEWGLTVL